MWCVHAPMNRPRLLDLFCKAGGCSVGYWRAGFEVVGVDIEPQPNYPFEFHQADALRVLETAWPRSFDAIHASPPCQAFTVARVIHGREHHDLLTPTRDLLDAVGLPYVIENVPNAPMRKDIVLCGSHFPELRVRRHRHFEVNWPINELMPPCDHGRKTVSVFGHGGHIYHGVKDWREAMGIDWMTRDELAQAIPPAYTKWIGRRLLDTLEAKEAA